LKNAKTWRYFIDSQQIKKTEYEQRREKSKRLKRKNGKALFNKVKENRGIFKEKQTKGKARKTIYLNKTKYA